MVIYYYINSINLGLNQLWVVIMHPIYTLAYTTYTEWCRHPIFGLGIAKTLFSLSPKVKLSSESPTLSFGGQKCKVQKQKFNGITLWMDQYVP